MQTSQLADETFEPDLGGKDRAIGPSARIQCLSRAIMGECSQKLGDRTPTLGFRAKRERTMSDFSFKLCNL